MRWIGLGLVGVTTVVMPISFDPNAAVVFALPKAELLGVLTYALGAAVALLVWTRGLRAIPAHRVHVLVGVYLITVIAASATSADPSVSIWGAYDRRQGLVAALQLAVLYLGVATFVRERLDIVVAAVSAALGGLLVLSYAFVQAAGLDPVSWGEKAAFSFSSLGNSNVLGHFMATLAAGSIAALLGGFIGTGSARMRAACAALSVAFVTGVILSQGRAAFLGLAAGVLLAIGATVSRLVGKGHGRVLAAGLVALTLVAGLGILLATPIGARVAALASGDLSVASRTLIYQSMLAIVRDHPGLGVGPDNVAVVYSIYRLPEALDIGAPLTSSAHGWPWRVAVETGIAGGLAYAGLLVALAVVAVREIVRDNDWRTLIFPISLGTYLAAGLFTVDHLGTTWMFWTAAGVIVGTTTRIVPTQARPRRTPMTFLAGGLVLGVLWPAAVLVNDIGASRAVMASRAPLQRPADALESARRAVAADGRWASHWTNLGQRAAAADDRGLALSAFERASAIAPYDALAWRNVGTLEAQLKDAQPSMRDRARASAQRAVAADPHNHEAHAGAAQIYLVLGDGPDAVATIEQALAARPQNDKYLELAAHAYRSVGRLPEARKAVLDALAVSETWERRYLLASILVLEQEFAAARAQLERVLQIDPSNRSATLLLDQIRDR